MPVEIEVDSGLRAEAAEGSSSGGLKTLFVRFLPVGSSARMFVLLLSYSMVLLVARNLAWQLRFDFDIPSEFEAQVGRNRFWPVALKLIYLALFGQFAGLLSYFSLPDLRRLLFACLAGSGTL